MNATRGKKEAPAAARLPYARTYRRVLLDMHIPDWDASFLREYDPESLADLYRRAGVTGAQVVCKSHLGLNYWPAPVGGIHPAARDRDLVGELCQALRDRDIAPALYHSVVFDNWAVEHHPDWAIRPPPAPPDAGTRLFGPRYGTACLNHPDYRAYEFAQLRELVRRYDIDALWIDMAFWTAVCTCEACRQRYRREHQADIPRTIDWSAPQWTRFQAARERWAEDFYLSLVDTVRAERRHLPVTHNLAPGLRGWLRGQQAVHARHDSFAAGDLYGGPDEQCVVAKLMLHLGRQQPAEFMTTRTTHLHNHVDSRSEHEMRVHAFATLAHGEAILFINAVDPRGSVNEGVYERLGRIFAATAPYEPFLGGHPVEDVAIYYSDASLVDPADNGRGLDGHIDRGVGKFAHLDAVTGAARALQRAHIPFGVITRDRLDRLDAHRVVVLPDVLRLGTDELEALRHYVRNGGRIYASGRTSLLTTDGVDTSDFALADVFGVHADGRERGAGVFVRPLAPPLRDALSPERYLAFGFDSDAGDAMSLSGVPRLSTDTTAGILAALTLPYGHPATGSAAARDFASIHSFPPWLDLDVPTIVSHRHGRGRCIYSAASIEAAASEAGAAVFSRLVMSLLDDAPTFQAHARPDTWITAFEQPEHARVLFSVLRHEPDPPAGTIPVTIRYRPPAGTRIRAVRHIPDDTPVPHAIQSDGTLAFRLDEVELFGVVLVDCMQAGDHDACRPDA